MITLPDRIAELVKQHGSLRATARVIQVDSGYLQRLSTGEKTHPSPKVLRRLGLEQRVFYIRVNSSLGPKRARA